MKNEVLNLLGQWGQVHRIGGQSLFQVNSRAIVYLRYSKDLGGGNFYFGVGEADFNRLRDENLFVLFICGHPEEVIAMPAATLRNILAGVPVSHGQWKLNILRRDLLYLLQVPGAGKFDVGEFRNYFDFAPQACKGPFGPTIRQHIPLQRPRLDREDKTARAALVHTAGALAGRLRLAVKNSDEPKEFEEVLAELFITLGLRCRHIGGPGETDVLIEEPTPIVVDGKSTRAPAISHVNFTRIKQHKAAHKADAMLVVSVAFQPAVVRDALLEGTGLITVEALQQILLLHDALPFSPFAYSDLFTRTGLLDGQVLGPLQESTEKARQWLHQALFLIDNLDFQPRTIHEIKGRLDVKCEQLGQEPLGLNELTKLLALLSDTPFNIVQADGEYYKALYHPDQGKLRLSKPFALEHVTAQPAVSINPVVAIA